VLFGPHDLALVSGAPAERRRFLDMTASMTDRSYLENLRSYRRVLTHRNAVLKAGSFGKARGVWDEELVKRGCELIEKRVNVVADLRSHMEPFAEALAVPYPIEMTYQSDLGGTRPDEVTHEAHFAAQLAAVESEELRRRTTLVGPHRDDVRIKAGGRDIRRFGSQGQRRLVAVLLRLAELSYLEGQLGEPCVLLLDDLFSELDPDVSEKLKDQLDSGHQIFVTSPVPLEWKNAVSIQSFLVSNGKVHV
jgi:DNA replication and repair protein RecF